MIFNPFTAFPFTFILISILIFMVQYLQNGNISDLNFRKLRPGDVHVILIAFVSIELIMDFVAQPIIAKTLHQKADYGAFNALVNRPLLFFKYLGYTWVSAAFGEELFFRAFLFTQLRKVIGNNSFLLTAISSLVFCIPHIYQELTGLITTLLFGIFFGYLYVVYKNIWINVLVHGLADTLFLALCFADKLSYYEITNRFFIGY